MSDIVERLRRWTFDVNAKPVNDLLDEAAAEIMRLRIVIDSYARSSKAAADEINALRTKLHTNQ